MKKLFHIFILASMAALLLVSAKPVCTVDKDEAKLAFDYLNKVRQSPKSYTKEIGMMMLLAKQMPELVWNDTLAQVAEARAMDMAEKDYFGHVNKKGEGVNVQINRAGYVLDELFIKKKKENSFESIALGPKTGIEAILGLIQDKGINPPNHRKHLLGMTSFWATCYDCGIGFVRTDNPEKPTYICVIIAKHKL
jgi:uncharacterized protein YkwD